MWHLEKIDVPKAMAAIAASFLLLVKPSPVVGAEGAALAQEASIKAKATQAESEWLQLKEEVQTRVEALPRSERVEFLREIAMGIASQAQSPDRERTAEAARFLIGASGTTPHEKAQAFSRLFATREPTAETTAERLLADLDVVRMPNGERRRDMSVYRAALEEGPGVTQSRLISYLFTRLPVESASWFIDNSELTEAERTRLGNELRQARQIVGSAGAPWEAGAGPGLSNAEREQKLRQWIVSPSWILQLLAKSLLDKYPPWLTPDLQLAVQTVSAPERVALRPLQSATLPDALNPVAMPTPRTTPVTAPQPTTPAAQTPALPAEHKSPVWPWLVGIVALVVIVAVALKRRA